MGDKLPELKRWYDGYRFGSVEIYNPWSVIRYIDEGCRFRPYWLNTSGKSILRVLLEYVDERRKEELEGLLKGKAVEAPVLENIVYADIHSNRNALFMMLLTTGYLKAVNIRQDERDMEWASLQIPNKEIRRAFQDEILGNRESGYGRFDIAFFPLKDGAPGIIMELKSAKSEEAMEEKAKEAIRQIDEKAYLAELSRQGVKEVWKYGIAFCGKKVWMEQGKPG